MDFPYYGFPGCPAPKPYEKELEDKRDRLSVLWGQDVGITPHPSPEHYRIRMDFVTTPDAMGLRRGGHDDVLDIKRSPILKEHLNQVWEDVRAWVAENDVSRYDLNKRTGWLRYVMLRGSDEVQVTITTASSDHEDLVEKLWEHLDVVSLVWTINSGRSDTSVGDVHKTYGSKTITIALADTPLLIDQDAFFQASPDAMEVAIKAMKPYVHGSVLDLYCGVGTIGLCLKPDRLTGVESNEHALALAKRNGDAQFILGDAASALKTVDADTVIVDPPRTGLQTAVHLLLAAKPQTIIYLSCNPRSQRTDVAALKRMYDVESIRGFDFFPRTDHIECLVILTLRQG